MEQKIRTDVWFYTCSFGVAGNLWEKVQMNDLTQKKCVPCEEGTPPLTAEQYEPLLKQLRLDWEVIDDKKIKHEFKFDSYLEGLEFAQKVGKLADGEDHHPNIHIYYKRVVIDLTTHNIGGLSENDFIMAAKIEDLQT